MRPSRGNEFEAIAEAPAVELCSAYPLVLDLDGTLLRADLLLESALHYLKRRPLGFFLLFAWACRGIAHLKNQLALRTELPTEHLPVNEQLAAYARGQADLGRRIIAASAANGHLAARACARFSFITEVIGSTDRLNLKGTRKAAALKDRFPEGFSYAGDSAADIAVWREARFGIFAGRDPRLLTQLQDVTLLEADFSQRRATLTSWVRAVRLHQWAKNGLVFLPLLLAGHLFDSAGWMACVAAFIAMGLTASGTYLINDLLDLDADRQHWTKRNRPFASGQIQIPQAVVATIFLLGSGLAVAFLGGGLPLLGALMLYCTTTVAYSLYLKRVPILDVTTLAALFTMRLGVGSIAASVRLSSWLAVFSMFLFLSLALAKRATEIGRKIAAGAGSAHGRGYLAADAPLINSLGVSTAFGAILMMVLYLVHEAFGNALYKTPELLWGAPVFIGLWLGRIWLLCGRGILHDDPVSFAVTDRISITLGCGVIASFATAALIA